MALTKCLSCGNDVSSEAAACPKCGHPIKAQPSGAFNENDPVHMIGIVLAAIFLLGVVVVSVSECNAGLQ